MDDPGLKAAYEEANIQTWSPEELEAYDYAGLRETEDRLRLEKAKFDAKKEEKMKIARQMKNRGIDHKTISELTGLPEDEI